jgi:hypothetical protein
MPKFFVPFAHSPEQAEFAYRGFLANSGASPFSANSGSHATSNAGGAIFATRRRLLHTEPQNDFAD